MAKHEAVDLISFNNNLLFLNPFHSLSLSNWHKRVKLNFDLLLLDKYCHQRGQLLASHCVRMRFRLRGLTAGVGTERTGTYPCSQNKQSVTQWSASDAWLKLLHTFVLLPKEWCRTIAAKLCSLTQAFFFFFNYSFFGMHTFFLGGGVALSVWEQWGMQSKG